MSFFLRWHQTAIRFINQTEVRLAVMQKNVNEPAQCLVGYYAAAFGLIMRARHLTDSYGFCNRAIIR
jgi:hypothetical protein